MCSSAIRASPRDNWRRSSPTIWAVDKVIWLERGIAGDDTHGHVDDITRFVAPNVVVTAYEPDTADPNHEPLRDNFLLLKKSTDQSGKPLRW